MWKSKLEFLPVRRNFAPDAVRLVVTSGLLGVLEHILPDLGLWLGELTHLHLLKKNPSLELQRSSCLIHRTPELQLEPESTFLLKNSGIRRLAVIKVRSYLEKEQGWEPRPSTIIAIMLLHKPEITEPSPGHRRASSKSRGG